MKGAEYIVSPLNYIGGKGRILDQILPLFPTEIKTFVDLFCGGCNVGINVRAAHHLYNDVSPALIGLLRYFGENKAEDIIKSVDRIIEKYKLSDTSSRGYSFYGCDSSKGVASYNKEKFLSLRESFNRLVSEDEDYYSHLYTLIVFGFNNQMRFNADGKYNLPVGKRDFNSQMKKKLLRFVEALERQNKRFDCFDFRNLDIEGLGDKSFIYADPPYLITTATYNENGGWTLFDDIDLMELLDKASDRNIKFAMSNVLTHKGRTNTFLIEWAHRNQYHVNDIRMDYNNSSYHGLRTEHETREVLITNYNPKDFSNTLF